MGRDRAHDSNFYDIHSVFSGLDSVEKAVELAASDLEYGTTWNDPYETEPISEEKEVVGKYKIRQVDLRQGWRSKGAIRIHYDHMAEDLNRTSMLEFVRGPLTNALNERRDIGEFCDRFDFYLQVFENRLPTKELETGLIELSDKRRDNLEEMFNNLEEDFSESENEREGRGGG